MPDTATPGAQLFPVDRLTENFGPDRPPIRTGRAYDLTYAVWQVHPSNRARPYRLYVMTDDGQTIDGQKRRAYGRPRVVPYHSLPSLKGVERRCLRLHLRHRTGRRALSLPVTRRKCPDVEELYREALGRDAERSNRRAAEMGYYMTDRDGQPMHYE